MRDRTLFSKESYDSMNFTLSILIKRKSWLCGFIFYALPVYLKLLDLTLTIYLLRFPWNYEVNPIALWIIQRGVLVSFVVFFSLSLLIGALIDHIFKSLLNPQIKKNIKILYSFTICVSYFLLVFPIANNVLIAVRFGIT